LVKVVRSGTESTTKKRRKRNEMGMGSVGNNGSYCSRSELHYCSSIESNESQSSEAAVVEIPTLATPTSHHYRYHPHQKD
jgi:hypothetical protein